MIVWDVYNEKEIDTPWCGTLTANCGCPTGCGCFFVAEGKMDKLIAPAANRGRENGQSLELNGTECSNALTTVGKDSVVVEKETKVLGRMEGYEMANRVYSAEGTAPALRTFQGGGLQPKIPVQRLSKWRIRKLTPRECFRLMSFSDEDFDKAASVVSNSQLYKIAGNSIAKDVLKALFLQMNIQGIRSWNDGNRAA